MSGWTKYFTDKVACKSGCTAYGAWRHRAIYGTADFLVWAEDRFNPQPDALYLVWIEERTYQDTFEDGNPVTPPPTTVTRTIELETGLVEVDGEHWNADNSDYDQIITDEVTTTYEEPVNLDDCIAVVESWVASGSWPDWGEVRVFSMPEESGGDPTSEIEFLGGIPDPEASVTLGTDLSNPEGIQAAKVTARARKAQYQVGLVSQGYDYTSVPYTLRWRELITNHALNEEDEEEETVTLSEGKSASATDPAGTTEGERIWGRVVDMGLGINAFKTEYWLVPDDETIDVGLGNRHFAASLRAEAFRGYVQGEALPPAMYRKETYSGTLEEENVSGAVELSETPQELEWAYSPVIEEYDPVTGDLLFFQPDFYYLIAKPANPVGEKEDTASHSELVSERFPAHDVVGDGEISETEQVSPEGWTRTLSDPYPFSDMDVGALLDAFFAMEDSPWGDSPFDPDADWTDYYDHPLYTSAVDERVIAFRQKSSDGCSYVEGRSRILLSYGQRTWLEGSEPESVEVNYTIRTIDLETGAVSDSAQSVLLELPDRSTDWITQPRPALNTIVMIVDITASSPNSWTQVFGGPFYAYPASCG